MNRATTACALVCGRYCAKIESTSNVKRLKFHLICAFLIVPRIYLWPDHSAIFEFLPIWLSREPRVEILARQQIPIVDVAEGLVHGLVPPTIPRKLTVRG